MKKELRDPGDFQIGATKKKYEEMKKLGRCPYDTFQEYLYSLLPELPSKPNDPAEQDFFSSCEKAMYGAFISELTKEREDK